LVAGAELVVRGASRVITRRASQAAKKEFREEYGPDSVPQQPTWRGRARYVTVLLVGIVLTVLGAECLVRGAVNIATLLGVSATIIGLTIVAIGTSAPELVTSQRLSRPSRTTAMSLSATSWVAASITS
jgi:Ca2+/Na+ antiporter